MVNIKDDNIHFNYMDEKLKTYRKDPPQGTSRMPGRIVAFIYSW